MIPASLREAGITDSLEHTFNYEMLSRVVQKELGKEFHLMEAACRAIAEKVLAEAAGIKSIKIRMHKMKPFLKGNIEASVVEWHYPEDY